MTGISSTTATSLRGAIQALGGKSAFNFDLTVSHVVCCVDENRRASSWTLHPEPYPLNPRPSTLNP